MILSYLIIFYSYKFYLLREKRQCIQCTVLENLYVYMKNSNFIFLGNVDLKRERWSSLAEIFFDVACEKLIHQSMFTDRMYYSDAIWHNRASLAFVHLFEQQLACSCVCRECLSRIAKQFSGSHYVKSDYMQSCVCTRWAKVWLCCLIRAI